MRVLHVIPSLSAVHGGPTRALEAMERALTAQGVEVETATTDDDGPGRRNGKPCGQPLAENGVVRWYFRKSAEFYKPSISFARWAAAQAGRFDLLHLHAVFSFTTTAGAWAARRRGRPYIVRPLGTLEPYGLAQRRPWLKALSMGLVDKPLLRGAAAVHFTSQAEALNARALGLALRELVIPLGVDAPPPVTTSRWAGPGPCVLFLSRLDPKKNLEGLLRAVALLAPAQPGLRLLVAGGGEPDYVASLHRLADTLGLGDRVQWAGHLEGRAKSEAFAAGHVFALPSFSENFGIAAVEALSAGLPCVLGQGVAIAEDVARAGAGVQVAPQPPEIAQGLRRIIQDESRRGAMSSAARRLARESYSTLAMGARLKQAYQEVLCR